jgi:fatty-acid desaturase
MIPMIFRWKTFQLGVKVIFHRTGNHEEFESVGINMLERVLLLLLDRFLEGADVLWWISIVNM